MDRFEEAMKHHMVNVPEHMLKIKQALEVPGAEEDSEEVERKEGLLEELLEIVENIDHAKGQHRSDSRAFLRVSYSRSSRCWQVSTVHRRSMGGGGVW